jgi:acetolactate synthase-1/2/3 large subunit
MARMTGGEFIAQMLQKEGVEKVFGIIDGTYFGLYANLQKYGIELISPRHESSAVHMAGAYARLTGKLGVCIASNGPGAANALPGVAVENGEGHRVLLITSTRRSGIGYPDRGGTFQYFNQVAVTRPMTKWSGYVASFDRIAEIMKRAFRKSHQGRPGVVHVDVPENIINGKSSFPEAPLPHSYRYVHPVAPLPELVEKAANLLISAKLPLIHAGSGVVHARAFEELHLVAEKLQALVCNSWGARGVFPENHPLAIPMTYVKLNRIVRNDADVVLTLGSRIGETDWWGKPPYWQKPEQQKMIQVDIDAENLGLNKPTEIAILGDIKLFLRELLRVLEQKSFTAESEFKAKMLRKYQQERQKERQKLDKHLNDDATPMHPAHVAKVCREILGEKAICVADGGNSVIWAQFYQEITHPNTLLMTFKFGMLGAGVSQTLAAAIACPDQPVFCVIGDGAMGFHPQEIETAVRNNLKPIYLVLCDRQWGMVKINQQFALKPAKTLLAKTLSPEETINTDFREIQFDKLAESMGAHGERVATVAELTAALERSLASGKCAVIHVDVDPVKHMWAPNLMEFKKMHQEPS